MTRITLGDAFLLNPKVQITKGRVVPFVAMDAIKPFTRTATATTQKAYSGGAKFCDGDVLMARITPCLENGKTSIYRSTSEAKEAAGSTEFIVARGRPDVSDSLYAYYLLTSNEVRAFAISQMTGSSGRQRVQADSFASYTVDLPSLREQRAITTILGALDDKIESNHKLINQLLAILDLYSKRLLGMGQRVVPLGEIVRVSRVSRDPASMGESLVDHFSIPAFGGGAWPDRVRASTIMSNKLVIEQASILVSRINPRFNRTWWCVPEAGVPALASTEFIPLTSEEPGDLGALWLAVRDEYFMNELKQRVTGTSGSHQRIRPDDLLTIDVPDTRALVPADKARALEMLTLVHQKRAESRRLAALRDALAPELLSGRMRVSEVATALQEALA